MPEPIDVAKLDIQQANVGPNRVLAPPIDYYKGVAGELVIPRNQMARGLMVEESGTVIVRKPNGDTFTTLPLIAGIQYSFCFSEVLVGGDSDGLIWAFL